MNILRRSEYKVMAWKNGGGITTEIAVFPPGSGLDGEPFQWRVSIAEVADDGGFSTFNGYDRYIMLLEGNGMQLEAAGTTVLDLTSPYQPQSFSGDQAMYGKLRAGPVRDFNLMVARKSGHGALDCRQVSEPLSLTGDGSTRLVYLIEGELSAGGHVLGTGETLILDESESATLTPLVSGARIALCSITTRHYPHPEVRPRP